MAKLLWIFQPEADRPLAENFELDLSRQGGIGF